MERALSVTIYGVLTPLFTAMWIVANLLVTGCSSHKDVSLRKFPYPYRAALAICSDIDETISFERFLALERFLTTTDSTPIGTGLGLEIGNSFWYYNQALQYRKDSLASRPISGYSFSGRPDFGIALYDGFSDTLATYAPQLLSLIKSGYIDCLHSYGHFSQGGFKRALAEEAICLAERESLQVTVWTNHGGKENTDNLGQAPWFLGDNPGSAAYHADITIPAGFRFIWRGQVTHCIGQDGGFSVLNLLKQSYEWMQDLRYQEQDYPHDNRLLNVYQLDDGRKVFEFPRFINPWGVDADAVEAKIAKQLGPSVIDNLIDAEGYLVFYTHLGITRDTALLSPSTIAALRYIRDKALSGGLFVTTTARLLAYNACTNYLNWHTEMTGDSLYIVIDSISNEVEGSYVPAIGDLQGITFYVADTSRVALRLRGRIVPTVNNPPDESGEYSISVPWKPLTFPSELRD